MSTIFRQRSAVPTLSRPSIEGLESRQFLTVSAVAPIPATAGVFGRTSAVDLATYFTSDTDDITQSTVRLTTPSGNIDIGTLDAQVPINAGNFIRYVTGGLYDNTVFQRFVPGFVLQGGTQTVDNEPISDFGTIISEPNGDRHNTRGTLAFTRVDPDNGGGPDSATSGFFINLADNSSTFDTLNGGFTVFGNVLGDGMTVVDALSLQAASARVITTARLLSDLTYSVSSSNPDQVTATLSGNAVNLNFLATNTASTITVTATDVTGNAVSSTFEATSTGFDVVLGGDTGNKTAVYSQGDGTISTVTLKGSGSATISLPGSGLSSSSLRGKIIIAGSVDQASIALTGTDTSTSISITTKSGVTRIARITGDGSLKSFSAKKATLAGVVNIAGSVQSLVFGSATASSITIGGSSGDKASTYAFGDVVTDTSLTSASPIKSIKLTSAVDSGAVAEAFSAPAIGSITSSDDFGLGVSMSTGNLGSLKVGGNLSGTVVVQQVKSISVKKDFTGTVRGTLSALAIAAGGGDPNSKNQQAIGSFKVGGALNGVIRSAGTVGSVSAASSVAGKIFVGAADPGAGSLTVPSSSADLPEPASLQSYKISKTQDGSFVVARNLGKASVGTLVTSSTNGGGGFFAVTIDSISAKTETGQKIKVSKPNSQAGVDTQLAGVSLGAILIKQLV